MAKLTVNDIDFQGKRVLTRVDFNVPMAEQDGAMVINDDTRIRASVETIKKFRMIPKELDHEDGELTATQKIKRNSMEEMFGELIEEMY